MRLQLIRHATLFLQLKGQNLLIDPMLSAAGTMGPVSNANNKRKNPLVDLPTNVPALHRLNAVIVTHMHRDHLDQAAIDLLPKDVALFCQPEDAQNLSEIGFNNVHPVEQSEMWNGIRLTRTKGRHGSGELGQKMGPVSGFILQMDAEPTLYIAGDTIWCPEVEEALSFFQPELTVVNAGAAQFLTGAPITMTGEDIVQVCKAAPNTQVIVVHMEAWNHCMLTREELRQYLKLQSLAHRVRIPEDGEWINLE